jgi:hypothetical protein
MIIRHLYKINKSSLEILPIKIVLKKVRFMKRYLILGIACTVLTACSNENSQTEQIVGVWKLMRAQSLMNSNSVIDYSKDNISYNFQANGRLIISGGDKIAYPNGEFNYQKELDFLSGSPTSGETKIQLVKIETNKWIYNYTNGEMNLSLSYIDGPDLYFKRY